MRQRAKVAGVCSALICMIVAWAAPATAATSGLAASAAAKPAGYKIVSADFSAPSGLDASGRVACPKVKGVQTVPLSGGALIHGNSLETSINSSWPAAKGWNADVNNASAAATDFTVYAVCAKKMTGYLQQKSAAVSNPAGAQNGAGYACPTGDVLLGGGALSSSHSTLVNLDSSWPAGTSIWYVYMNNASSARASFNVYHTLRKAQRAGHRLPARRRYPRRERGGYAVGGLGVLPGRPVDHRGWPGVVSSTSIDVTLNTTFPFAGGWGGDENNGSGANANLTAYVLCAS